MTSKSRNNGKIGIKRILILGKNCIVSKEKYTQREKD